MVYMNKSSNSTGCKLFWNPETDIDHSLQEHTYKLVLGENHHLYDLKLDGQQNMQGFVANVYDSGLKVV